MKQILTYIFRCDVSDALCKLKYRNGGFLSGLTLWSPQRQSGETKIVGPAYTVKYVPVDDPAPKHPTHYVSISKILMMGDEIWADPDIDRLHP